jgi:dTMP kinase
MSAAVAETRGAYVVLEGGEGVGKSTQAARLALSLEAVLTRETGGTLIGQSIRTILHDTNIDNLSFEAEAFLVAADRAQHIHEVVEPALSIGRHVVSDRNWWSTIAYQGFGRQLDINKITTITHLATGRYFQPDLVFVLRAGKEALKDRMRGRELDRFELAGDEFHDRVDSGYEYLLDTYNGVVINTENGI